MNDRTRPATWADVVTVARLRDAHGVSWALIGGYALAAPTVDGVPIRVLDLEGLLLTKEGQRDKDRMDAKILRRALDAMKPE